MLVEYYSIKRNHIQNKLQYRPAFQHTYFDTPGTQCYISLHDPCILNPVVTLPLNILVLAKQVVDPEMPISAFRVDGTDHTLIIPPNIPPVVNGFDENAIEAALRVKDVQDSVVTVLSMGQSFALDVMKKPLSMGADHLVLLQDEVFHNSTDSYVTAYVLTAAIRKLGEYDLIIAGRQASDWDNAQVPLAIAEFLDIPSITIGKKVEVGDGTVTVERQTLDGTEVIQAPLPTLVTITNELGQPRYPTLRGIMAATRKQPEIWTAKDLDLDPADLQPKIETIDLYIPVADKQCELIEGEDESDSGRLLALKLREAKLI